MVLKRVVLALAMLVAGCNQSLFDNGPGGGGDDEPPDDGGTDDTPPVPMTCPTPCVGDAGGDFDGSDIGTNARWRYLDDTRNRAWTPMTGTTAKAGSGMNAITSCMANPTAPACAAIPNALLFSSTGTAGQADPAIELTIPETRVLQISLRIHVPAGANPQGVRLYRSAREDVLYTGVAAAGTTLEHAVVLDALQGDRFLLAIAPNGQGAADVAVQMFVSETGEAFPKTCQLAVGFNASIGNTVANLCRSADVLTAYDEIGTRVETAPVLVAGPFPESGMSADFVEGRFYDSTVVPSHIGDSTMQLWIKHDMFVPFYSAYPLSDMDLDDDDAGGFAVELYDNSGTPQLVVTTCKQWEPTVEFTSGVAAYPNPTQWHFVRVSHEGGTARVCLDGVKVVDVAIPAGEPATSYAVRIGKNSRWTPAGSFFDGQIDDVRVFTGALPCD